MNRERARENQKRQTKLVYTCSLIFLSFFKRQFLFTPSSSASSSSSSSSSFSLASAFASYSLPSTFTYFTYSSINIFAFSFSPFSSSYPACCYIFSLFDLSVILLYSIFINFFLIKQTSSQMATFMAEHRGCIIFITCLILFFLWMDIQLYKKIQSSSFNGKL